MQKQWKTGTRGTKIFAVFCYLGSETACRVVRPQQHHCYQHSLEKWKLLKEKSKGRRNVLNLVNILFNISDWGMTKLVQTNEWFSHSVHELEMFSGQWGEGNIFGSRHCLKDGFTTQKLEVVQHNYECFIKNCYEFHRCIWISWCTEHIKIFEHKKIFECLGTL